MSHTGHEDPQVPPSQRVHQLVSQLSSRKSETARLAAAKLADYMGVEDDTIQNMVYDSGAIEPLVKLLRTGNADTKAAAASALAALILGEDERVEERINGVFAQNAAKPLADLIESGNLEGKTYAVQAIKSLCYGQGGSAVANRQNELVRSNIMGPLLRLVRDDDILPCRNACGAIAFLMTGEDEGVESRIQSVFDSGALEAMLNIIREANDDETRSWAALALRGLGYCTENHDQSHAVRARTMVQAGAIPPLVNLLRDGSDMDKMSACGALANIMSGEDPDLEDRVAAVYRLRVLELCPALFEHWDEEMKMWAALIIRALAAHDSAQATEACVQRLKEILSSDCIRYLKQVLVEEHGYVDAKCACAEALGRLMFWYDELMEWFVQRIVELKFVPILCQLLTESNDLKIQEAVAICLQNMAHSFKGADALAPHLKDIMDFFRVADDKVKATLLYLLGNITSFSEKDVRRKMVEYGAVELLMPLMKKKDEHPDLPEDEEQEDGSMVVAIAMSNLIGHEEGNQLLSTRPEVFQMFYEALSATLKKDKYKGISWSSSDLTQALANLSMNDSNKEHIIQSQVVPLLHQALRSTGSMGDAAAQEHASRTIWNLTFMPSFAEDPDGVACGPLTQTLKELSLAGSQAVRNNSTGALFQIRRSGEEMSKKKKSLARATSIKGGHIMLSYNWKHKEVIMWIRDYLKRKGFKCWLGVDTVSNPTMDTMAKAIEDAGVVLVCLSDAYKESEACRTEAEYAYSLGKPIVPIKVEDYEATGWLGALADHRVQKFDFSDEANWDSVGHKLVNELALYNIEPGTLPPSPEKAQVKSALVRAETRARSAEAEVLELQRQLQQLATMSSTEIDEVPLTASLDVSQQVEQLSREFQRQFDELNQRIEDLEAKRHKRCCIVQ